VTANSLPLVVDFNSDTAKQIFQGKIKNHFLMFQSAESDQYEHNLHNARKVAKELKGEMMFVTITTDEDEHKRVLDFFAITEEEVPTFRISAGDDMVKFKPDNKELSDFVTANSLPLVVDFNSDTAKQIFQGKIKNHFLGRCRREGSGRKELR